MTTPDPKHPSPGAARPRPKGAPGVKLLISAAALAATLGGWTRLAAIHGGTAPPAPPPGPTMASADQLPAASGVEPLPTLVPLVTPPMDNGASPVTRPQVPARSQASAPPVPARRPQPLAFTRSSR